MQKPHLYKDIIEGCIRNQRKAQEQLYQCFYESMMNLCLRYTKNQQDAIEVMHNGFLKVFKHIGLYNEGISSLYTWIRTIMVNAAIDFIRKRNKLHAHLSIEFAEMPVVSEDIIQKLDAGELLLLIRQLPPATQMVFNLYVVDGYHHKEIANLCGISEGTSKWHLSEAKRLLKQMIRISDPAYEGK